MELVVLVRQKRLGFPPQQVICATQGFQTARALARWQLRNGEHDGAQALEPISVKGFGPFRFHRACPWAHGAEPILLA